MKIAALTAFALTVSCGASAQPSSRPLTVIVPFPPRPNRHAGPHSHCMRLLGQPVIIENVTGAGASIALLGQQARPTHHASIGNWTSRVALCIRRLHDAPLEMQPVAMVSATPLMIIGRNALPPKDASELIAWLKANPDKISAATVGAGSAAHVCLLYFQQKTGTSFQLVPYRGGAPVMQDLVAGQIDMFCAEASQTLSFLRAGTIKAYAVMSKTRWPAAPEVPTLDEVGAPGMYISF